MKPVFYSRLLLLLLLVALPWLSRAQAPALTTNAFRVTSFCAGSQLAVGFQAGSGFSPANTYTAELSDASGSFRRAVAIGILAGNATTGLINATLPAGTPTGTGYRIRVVASRPAVQGADNGANLTITNLSAATATSNAPLCPGSTLRLSATAPAGAAFVWTGPNRFSSTQAMPTIANVTAAQAGTYTVNVTLNGCSESRTVSVSVFAAEKAGFSYFATAYCKDPNSTAKATLAAGATAGVFTATPAGLSLDAATGTVNVTASTAGTYNVTNTTQGRCPATATQTITIKPAATLAVSPNQTVCAGTTVKLTASGTDAYVWKYDNQTVVNSTITVAPTKTTTYTVTGTTIGACNTVTKSVTVTVAPVPKVDFSYPVLTCQGSGTANVTLAAGATAGTFSATPTGLVLHPTTGEVDLGQSKAGTYTVTNKAGGSCPASATAKLTIQARPVLVVTGNQTVCAGTAVKLSASGADAYVWKFDNESIVNSTITVAPTKTTTYTVTGSRLGCASVTKTVTVTVGVCTANRSTALDEALQVYPNPGTGHFTLQLPHTRHPQHLRVLNALGQVVWEGRAPAGTTAPYTLNLRQQPAGMYLLQLTVGSDQTSRRLLIRR